MNTPSFCDATSAVAITRYTKPAKNKRAIFLAVVAVALLSYITIVQGGVYVPI